jgi:ribosomal protein S12 methylthiotransferase accessory factor
MFEVRFPGGVRVEATWGTHVLRTDQPPPLGEGSAPSPFDLFLGSIATCAGFYALRFCQQRGLATEGLALTMAPERDASRKRVEKVRIEVALPDGFPEKYRDALLRAIDQCTVKRHLAEPPAFDVVTVSPAGTILEPTGSPAGVCG